MDYTFCRLRRKLPGCLPCQRLLFVGVMGNSDKFIRRTNATLHLDLRKYLRELAFADKRFSSFCNYIDFTLADTFDDALQKEDFYKDLGGKVFKLTFSL